ncbi:HNH endonuclease [Erwinia billingiae]|uniref:HNH endonuclease n=1 Tax=Erwinia billingiae TaxID=182337 RepID=UPI00069D239A|nr:hypothetical protein [Erwinia billingiae]
MSSFNRYGLPRHIPEKVKRVVRQRDGFGCVLCATPIIDYEHVDPLFIDATCHDPAAITLLCPTCHRKVTSGQISKELVKKAMRDPAAKKAGQIGEQIYFCDSHPKVIFAGASFTRCDVPIHILGEDLISIDFVDGKYLLSACFWDEDGEQTLKIIKNEWVVSSEKVWDFRVIGNRIQIHQRMKKPAMTIRVENNNTFIVENFNMLIKNRVRIEGNQEKVIINGNHFPAFNAIDCTYGIYLE